MTMEEMENSDIHEYDGSSGIFIIPDDFEDVNQFYVKYKSDPDVLVMKYSEYMVYMKKMTDEESENIGV